MFYWDFLYAPKWTIRLQKTKPNLRKLTKKTKKKKKKLSNSARVSLLGHFCWSQARIKEEGWNSDIKKQNKNKNQQKKVNL